MSPEDFAAIDPAEYEKNPRKYNDALAAYMAQQG